MSIADVSTRSTSSQVTATITTTSTRASENTARMFPHHSKTGPCFTRPAYRDGRQKRAVKVCIRFVSFDHDRSTRLRPSRAIYYFLGSLRSVLKMRWRIGVSISTRCKNWRGLLITQERNNSPMSSWLNSIRSRRQGLQSVSLMWAVLFLRVVCNNRQPFTYTYTPIPIYVYIYIYIP